MMNGEYLSNGIKFLIHWQKRATNQGWQSSWRLTSGTVLLTMTSGLLAGKISLPNSLAGYHGRDRILPNTTGQTVTAFLGGLRHDAGRRGSFRGAGRRGMLTPGEFNGCGLD